MCTGQNLLDVENLLLPPPPPPTRPRLPLPFPLPRTPLAPLVVGDGPTSRRHLRPELLLKQSRLQITPDQHEGRVDMTVGVRGTRAATPAAALAFCTLARPNCGVHPDALQVSVDAVDGEEIGNWGRRRWSW